jgi:hypothetical protein
MKTFTGQKIKWQLVPYGDPSSTTNCRTKYPQHFKEYLETFAALKMAVFTPRFPAELLMMFYGNLVGKYWPK